MKTYTIDWERNCVMAENLTFAEMLDTLAQLVADDYNEFDNDDFYAIIEEYYIDEYDEEGEQTNGADSRADEFLGGEDYCALCDKIRDLINA